MNAVHGSDTVKEAEWEIKFFFPTGTFGPYNLLLVRSFRDSWTAEFREIFQTCKCLHGFKFHSCDSTQRLKYMLALPRFAPIHVKGLKREASLKGLVESLFPSFWPKDLNKTSKLAWKVSILFRSFSQNLVPSLNVTKFIIHSRTCMSICRPLLLFVYL